MLAARSVTRVAGRVAVCCVVVAGASCRAAPASGPSVDVVRVGVLLDASSPDGAAAVEDVRRAAGVVNDAGGVRGRPIELVVPDTTGGIDAPTRTLAADDTITTVIGPATTDDLLASGPALLAAGKVVITPGATSTAVSRAFAGQPQLWTTAPSDDAAVPGVLAAVARDGATSVALLAAPGAGGRAMADTFPSSAADASLRAAGVHRYPGADCDGEIDAALAVDADVLVAFPPTTASARCTVQRRAAAGSQVGLVLAGSGFDPSAIAALGTAAEGVELATPAVDPGFGRSGTNSTDGTAPPAAANRYDALLLAAYGLERSALAGGAALTAALGEIGRGQDPASGWDVAGVRANLAALAAGRHPALTGAGGPLAFAAGAPTERLGRAFDRAVIHGGRARPMGRWPTVEVHDGAASAGIATPGSPEGARASESGRTGLWVLLVATSTGVPNTRHQADVLAFQALLRRNGVAADHIVTVADDLVGDAANPEPGVLRNEVGGPNLLDGATIDLRPDTLDAAGLLDVLEGRPSPARPKVLHSGPGDDVLVVLVGHGDRRGVHLGLEHPPGPADDAAGSILGPVELGDAVREMHLAGRYRRLLVVADSCFSGALGTGFVAPGATLLAAASPDEESSATNRDPATGSWLADELANQLWRAAGTDPDLTLGALGRRLAVDVRGSHVTTFATPGPAPARLRDFVTP